MAVIFRLKIIILIGCEFDVLLWKSFLIWQVLIKSENFLRITWEVKTGNANIEITTVLT
jgi:hypothetical protein